MPAADEGTPPPRAGKRIGGPISAPQRVNLEPSQIARDPAFRFRRGRDPAHVRSLMQAARSGAIWDPIVVWRERSPSGELTGRLVLLDGDHRLAAFASLGKRVSWQRGSLPAIIVTGDRNAALSRALEANTKATLPLTSVERADAAWRLTCDPLCTLSKASIARLSGIGTTLVATMRQRLGELQAAGRAPSGSWYVDRQDHAPGGERPELTPAEVATRIEALAKAHGRIMMPAPRLSPVQNLQAYVQAVGYRTFLQALEGYMGSLAEIEERFATPVQLATGTQDEDF